MTKRSRWQEEFGEPDMPTRPDAVSDEVWEAFLDHVRGKPLGQLCRERGLGRTFVEARFCVIAGRTGKWRWVKDDGRLLTFDKPPALRPCKWCGREDWTPAPAHAVFCSDACRQSAYGDGLKQGRETRLRQRTREWIIGMMLDMRRLTDNQIDDLFEESWIRQTIKDMRDAALRSRW